MTQTIHHQDCCEGMKLLEDNSVHLTVTSPPYYNARDYSTWETYEDYLQFLTDTFTEVFRITKEGRMCVINISPIIVPRKSRSHESTRLPLPFHLFAIMEKLGWKYIDDIVWKKPNGAARNRNGGFFQHRKPVAYKPNIVTETIFIFQKPAKFLIDKILRSYDEQITFESLVQGEYEKTNVWEIQTETRSEHTAPFPVGLSDRIVQYYSFVDDVVLDPFLGSGTTLVSCQKYNRRGIGYEIHEEYVDLAHRNLQSTSPTQLSLWG